MSEFSFRVSVLGCKVNQYESEQIKSLLNKSGGGEVGEHANCDLIVIHSCAVTAEALRKVRQMIRRAADGSSTQIVVSGCAARSGLLDAGLPEFLGVEPGTGWLQRLARTLRGRGFPIVESDGLERDMLPLDTFSGHHRAFLKIQDGCDIHCSYCIVPSLRGSSRDKPLPEILDEAARLVAGGHREIVLTGVSIGLYGARGGVRLAEVLNRVAQIEGVERLRLSSLHPADLDEELLEVWSRNRNIMPHIHLPLQSGSDRILRSMQRGYDSGDFMRAVERANNWLDTPAITTDIIVGFPGETEEDFEDTVDLSKQVGFPRMHIFPYSPRPGTRANDIADTLSPQTVKDRVVRLRELAAELKDDFNNGLLGRTTTVLAERYDEREFTLQGYTERYAQASFSAPQSSLGRVHSIRIESVLDGTLLGERCATDKEGVLVP